MRARRSLVGPLACALALLAACASSEDRDPRVSAIGADTTVPAEPGDTTTTTAPPACDPRQSLRPPDVMPEPGDMPPGGVLREIQDRGRLIVGVADDALRFSFLNPLTGQIEGFDVDVAKEVAEAIFGDPEAVELRAIAYSQRIPVLEDGSVDIVVDTFTINCTRKTRIGFSTVYFEAGQKVLVRTDSGATSIQDLAGQRVCAAAGSTSLENLERDAPGVERVEVEDQTDCLVLFQRGEVDAISTDDTILAGLAAQDPFATIVGPAFSEEPYGIGVNLDNEELLRFVNGVLERMRADETWTGIYSRWLDDLIEGPVPAPPLAAYAD